VESFGLGGIAYLEDLVEYGPMYLTAAELEMLKDEAMKEYYRFLGGSLLKMREKEFWKCHAGRLRALGNPMRWSRVMRCALDEVVDEMHNPRAAFRKLPSVLRQRYDNMLGRRPSSVDSSRG